MKQSKRMAALLLAVMLIVGILPLSAGAKNLLPDDLPTVAVPELNVEDLKPLEQALMESTEDQALPPPAENEIHATGSGICGDNLTWKYESNDLTISGTGAMYDYSDANPAPWGGYIGGVKNIIIEEGVTSIGDLAFTGFTHLIRVYVFANVSSVGSRAFEGSAWCTPYFMGDAPAFADDAFAGFECKAYYFRDWDASVLQNYGGEADWEKGTIYLSPDNKQLYALNEPIKAEDLIFYAYANVNYPFRYTPGKIEIGEYDNSTYGQKTVQITVDGTELTYTYMVSDGENHLDLITVDYDPIQYARSGSVYADPIVRDGDTVLNAGEHYTISYKNNLEVGTDASFTITGKGIYEGYQRTFPFAILKRDLSNAYVTAENVGFYGQYMTPEVNVEIHHDGVSWTLTEGEDYQLIYEDNVNVGTATVRAVGMGKYCGTATCTFQIAQEETSISLSGAYNGNAYDEELNDEYYYVEGLMCPGEFTGTINSTERHVAYYGLYRIENEEAVLVKEYESDYGVYSNTKFTYDFTDVYNSTSEDGGEVYMLTYSWMESDYDVYSGACVMYIPSKVPQASSMTMGVLSEDNDFREEYVTVFGDDGVVDYVTWNSSDSSVAAVENGIVTLKKPGTATISAASGSISVSDELTIPSLDLADAVILNHGNVYVIYDGKLLIERTDYVQSVSTSDNVTEVSIIGKGLFEGQLLRQFDAATGEAIGHTHVFDNACDDTCSSCDFTRDSAHQYGTSWTKDMDGHWHACTVCGDKADYDAHTLSPDDDTLCTVCGTLYIPGDLNKDFTVNEDDAIYLLQHVLLPDYFPVEQAVDYTGDGQVNEDDAIYLLQHVLLPDFFPL